jgi:hypothetical protein
VGILRHKFSRVGWGVLIFACLVCGASGGWGVSKIIEKSQQSIRQARRAELKTQLLAGMGTIQIGDTLVDCEFDDVDGVRVRLSDLVKARRGMLIGVINPDCMACIDEITNLRALVPDSIVRDRIIFISAGNVQELLNLRRISGVTNKILCDRRGEWSSRYGFYTFPFNFVVGRDMAIQSVIPSALTGSIISEFVTKTESTR